MLYTQSAVSRIDGMATADMWMGNYDISEKEYLTALVACIKHMVDGAMNNWMYKIITDHIISLYEDISDVDSAGKYSSLLWQQQEKSDYDLSLDSFRRVVSSQFGEDFL